MASGKSGAAVVREQHRVGGAPEIVVLRPWLSERIWGCMELPAFLEQPKPGHPVGEAWLTSVDCVVEGQSSRVSFRC